MKYFLILLLLSVSVSCRKDNSCDTCRGENKPPVALAGPDQVIMALPSISAMLDGSKSYDPDGKIIEWHWSKISGPATFTLLYEKEPKAAAINLDTGLYQVELKVTDNSGLTSRDTVSISVIIPVSPNPDIPPACDNSNRPIIEVQLIQAGLLSMPRSRAAAVSSGSKIFLAGGSEGESLDCIDQVCPGEYSSRIDIFDTSDRQFRIASLSIPRYGIGAVAAGKLVFFAGGYSPEGSLTNNPKAVTNIDVYNMETNQWSLMHLSVPRAYVAAGAVGNKVFFAGGQNRDSFYDIVDIYDLATGTWSLAYLNEARAGISAVTVRDVIYFAGGWKNGNGSHIVSTIDMYNARTETWHRESLQKPMAEMTGVAAGNNIFWASGCSVVIFHVPFTVAGSSFIETGQFFKQGYRVINDGQNAVVKDNKVIFFTGWNEDDRFDIYDLTTRTWQIGRLPFSLYGTSIVSLNNTIYIAGGYRINDQPSDKFWRLEF
jgi:hypothetical protein